MLPVDWPADAKPVVVAVTVSGEKQDAQAAKVKQRHAKADHGEATSTEPAK